MKTKAKTPSVSLLKISETTPFFEDIQTVVVEQFQNEIKTHVVYDQFWAKQTNQEPEIFIGGFFLFY